MRCFVDDVSSYDAQQELTPQFQVEHHVDCVRVSLLLVFLCSSLFVSNVGT